VDKGSGYISRKTEGRFDAETDVSVGTGNFLPVHAMANKLMKEGAREMEREAGTVAKGSDAAMAQSVYWHKDDVASPQHEVAEKVRMIEDKRKKHRFDHMPFRHHIFCFVCFRSWREWQPQRNTRSMAPLLELIPGPGPTITPNSATFNLATALLWHRMSPLPSKTKETLT